MRTDDASIFHNTLDSLKEGLQLISFDWKYLYVNNAVVKQSKYESKEDLLGYTMMEKYPGIEGTPMFKTLTRCMKERVSVKLDNEFRFPNQSTGWFELRVEAVPDGIFILSLDVTERRKAEENKREHIRKLEEMMFMTSHKVRQPVAHILGVSNLLDKAVFTKNELQKITGYMRESAQDLDEFTRELTDFMHNIKITAKENNWA